MNQANEPAFPVLYGQTNGADGLTKRELLAGLSLNAIVSNSIISEGIQSMKRESILNGMAPGQFEKEIEFPSQAYAAVALADALLKQLERGDV